jgi:hypothetical protein
MADRYWVAGGTGNYNSTTNWSATSGGASGATVPGAADNVFFNAASGAGTATINVASNCLNLNLTGFTGTIVFNANWAINGTIFNLGTGGYTINASTFLLALNSSMTITSNGTTWTGTLSVGAITVTLADNLTINGACKLNQIATLNGNTLNINGSLTHSANGVVSGTTTIVFTGTGTWNHTNTGALRNNVTINTAGTLTLGTNVYYNTGTLTYVAGTVVTTGSTLNIGAATTLNTNGISWNNITTSGAATITLSSNLTLTGTLTITAGSTSFVLGAFSLISTNANLTIGTSGTFTMPANQTFKTLSTTGAGIAINSNTLTITENLTIANGAPVSGTTSIIYAGTGTWTAGGTTAIINNPFTINTLGTLTVSGIVYKSGAFTYTAGTIDDTTGTVTAQSGTLNLSGVTFRKLLVNNNITLASNINAITFGTFGANATTFTLAGNTINFTHLELGNSGTTTLPTAWVCQDIEFKNVSPGILNGNSITINGNILQSSSATYSGTTSFIYAGTGAWNSTSTGYFINSFTINTAGTLTFISANIGGGIFTYTAGTVITTGSILYIRTAATTMNHGTIVWNDVTLGTTNILGSGPISNITLNSQLICLGTLTLNVGLMTFGGTNGTFDTYNFLLGIDGTARTTTLLSTKTYRVRQSLTCTQPTNAIRLTLKSSVAASQAIFTVDQGATIDVGFVNATDINSSLGRPIYSYRGVFSNTLNWNLLPTDVTPKVNTFAN